MCLHNYYYICDGKRKKGYRFTKWKMTVECVVCRRFPSEKTNLLKYEGEMVTEGVYEHCHLVYCRQMHNQFTLVQVSFITKHFTLTEDYERKALAHSH